MQRLAEFDVSRQFITGRGKLAAQLTFGAICAAAMIGLRSLYDMWAPESGPFALIYPTVLLATFYGHWRAGLVSFVVTFFWAWYFVLPGQSSFFFTNPTDPARVLLNAVCCLIVIIFAEAFRRAAQSTMKEIRERADKRLTLLAELEHRTKNNFALVASLLEIQKRQMSDPSLHGALEDAVGRVRTFADAYSTLTLDHEEGGDVAMKPYLDVLLDRIERAALTENINVYREIEPMRLPSETAVAIGLYLNEAISNCAKYAFPEGRLGKIGVFLQAVDGGWRLTVEDDGVGEEAIKLNSGGLGKNLMLAFAHQAGASHSAGPVLNGFRNEMAEKRSELA
ncbi:histidine kinase dimerization/phosphoacceptor domain -containing protein [Qipengyuania sp. G39]|uniref:histidine kinase n=1 Tax=Qipengyuania profundimaris TaxID=3067652 RepID=A0ABT9HPP3_9SPHN|nr:histidine kinase dimerization/phosphoacceptor domain -containing protein [Qipengyuania sp. G39]MDP4574985.1 histidine kinase dimerization/phosphoacceptor domain -containing protein [Qipengyuania sp. G39]